MLHWLQQRLTNRIQFALKIFTFILFFHAMIFYFLFFFSNGKDVDFNLILNSRKFDNKIVKLIPYLKKTGALSKLGSNFKSNKKITFKREKNTSKLNIKNEKSTQLISSQKNESNLPKTSISKDENISKNSKKNRKNKNKKNQKKEDKKIIESEKKIENSNLNKASNSEIIKKDSSNEKKTEEDLKTTDELKDDKKFDNLNLNIDCSNDIESQDQLLDQNEIFLGHQEFEIYEIQKELQEQMVSIFAPPIGINPNISCNVYVSISKEGSVLDCKLTKPSGILIFDVEVENAVHLIKFPKQLWSKSLEITFTV